MFRSVTMATVVAISTTEALQVDQWKRPQPVVHQQKDEWIRRVNLTNPYAIKAVKKAVVPEK